MFDLSGKVALVTGSSGAIGGAIAKSLALAGSDVACHFFQHQEPADKLVNDIQAFGRMACSLRADLRDPFQAEKLVEDTVERLGNIHILVNNAGINHEMLLLRSTSELVEEIVKTNLISMINVSKVAVRKMTKNHWGRLIHLSSVVAHTGSAAQTAYASSKAGIEGMSRAIARELGGRNITSNVIAPGYIDAGMSSRMNSELREMLLPYIALGRTGKPEEIAYAVVFLASEEASYITGTVLHVNGGMYMQ